MKKRSVFLIGLLIIFVISFILGSLGVGNKTIEEAPIGSSVRVLGQDLRYIEKGSGQDVLLIHGTPGSIEDWQPLFDSLAKKYHVIAYDRPGHGFSSARGIKRNLNYHSSMANAIIDHFKLDSAIVIGHSYGGCISMKMAIEGNDKVNRFYILASPLFTFHCESIYKLFKIPGLKTALSWLVSGWYAKTKIQSELPQRFGPNHHLANEKFINYRKELWSQPKVILSKSLETANIQKDLSPLIPQYQHLNNEVTIIMGEDDVPHYQSDLKAALPLDRVEAVFFENTGHFIQIEKTSQLLRYIK